MTNDYGAPINDESSELAKNKNEDGAEFPLLTNIGGEFCCKIVFRNK